MKNILIIRTERSGYSPEQCGNTLTVGQLKEILEGYDEEERIYLSNDNGYTYGAIRYESIDEDEIEDDEE